MSIWGNITTGDGLLLAIHRVVAQLLRDWYKQAERQPELRPIQVGLRTGTGVVEILSGVKPGEAVVTEGSDRLADGIPVEVLDGGAAGAEAAGPPPPAAK